MSHPDEIQNIIIINIILLLYDNLNKFIMIRLFDTFAKIRKKTLPKRKINASTR